MNTKGREKKKPGRSSGWRLFEDKEFHRTLPPNYAGRAWGAINRDHEANVRMVCMEGERKVILSALTSVGYIRYYIVSVYQVYGVQRSYLREREKKNFFFIKRSTHDGEHVYVCMCMCVSVSVRWSNHGKYWFYRKLLPTKMMQLKGDATLSSCFEGMARKGSSLFFLNERYDKKKQKIYLIKKFDRETI